MNVSDIGEFGLIARLADIVGRERPSSLLIGIGDDAAAWRSPQGTLLATTDTMIGGVHFLPDRAPWPDVGWKALAINVSDIAAMGGIPQFALATIGVPPELPLQAVDGLYAGLQECADAYGVTIVGGDVVRSRDTLITVALLGRAQADARGRPLLLRRDAARPGHAVAVSGSLGDSAGGLRLLKQGAPSHDPLVRTHLRPRPPLAAGQEAVRLGVRCAIDISDGLLQDLGHICQSSGLGAVVHAAKLPLSTELRATLPAEALALAAGGGEDYQLLLVAPAARLHRLRGRMDLAVTVIGEMVEDDQQRARLLDEGGGEIALSGLGWNHLRPDADASSGRPSGRRP